VTGKTIFLDAIVQKPQNAQSWNLCMQVQFGMRVMLIYFYVDFLLVFR